MNDKAINIYYVRGKPPFESKMKCCLMARLISTLEIIMNENSVQSGTNAMNISSKLASLKAILIEQSNLTNESDLIQDFQRVAAQYPHAIAIQNNNLALNYSKLDKISNQYAHLLLEKGISSGDKILLYLERSIDVVVLMLAALKIGAIYIPIDPRYAMHRIHQICKSASAKIIISSKDLNTSKFQNYSSLVYVENLRPELNAFSTKVPIIKLSPNRIAYIIFTSGSTGVPKGVEVRISGISRLARSSQLCEIDSFDKVAFASSISFDTSVFEIWGALLNGAKLVVFTNDEIFQPRLFSNALGKYDVSTLWLTSTNFNNLYQFLPNVFAQLKNLLIGGEALNATIVKNLLYSNQRPQNIINAYGPTEGTVFALAHKIEKKNSYQSSIPIGKPIADTHIYVLDKKQCPVKEGAIGELYLGGKGVAAGYVNSPEKTKASFFPDHWEASNNGMMYRTGDMVRQLNNGDIEYLGRNDEQVKIRGYRVEVGSIEAHIQNFPNIYQASVQVHESKNKGKYLVGYYTHRPDTIVKIRQLREYLKKQIAPYAIPAFFVSIDQMPLTPHGKIDKSKLAQLHSKKNALSNECELSLLPRNNVEFDVLEMFRTLLEIEAIQTTDDFFEIGGHSLLALRLLAELEQNFGVEIELHELYPSCTVEKLALKILNLQKKHKNKVVVPLNLFPAINTPLFVFHPIGGTCFCYLPLATQIGCQRAIYGVQDPSINKININIDSIEEMATFYLQQIQQIQPHGPYNLAGSSFGATIVVEVIKQLEEQGEQVACAALIDGFADFSLVKQRFLHDRSNYLQELQNLMPGDISEDSPYFETMCQRLDMLLKYQVPTIKTPVVLFKAKDVLQKFEVLSSADNGWGKYSTVAKVYEIPGTHETMLAEPNVTWLAKSLNECLVSVKRRKLISYKKSA